MKGDTLVELGTHASQLLEETVRVSGDQTIDGVKTFTEIPKTSGLATAPEDVVNYAKALSMLTGSTTVDRLVVSGTAGENVTAGNLAYLKESDGKWWKCDADTAATVENIILGIIQATTLANASISGGVLIQGIDSNQTGLTNNTVYYASNTAGEISNTPGTKEVTLGISRSTTSLLFLPRYNQQLTEDQQDALGGTSGTPSNLNKFVTNDDTSSSVAASKLPRTNSSGRLPKSFIPTIGGDGSDGALTITSGTTTIDLGGVENFVKNYSSISITGTGALAFINPHNKGTVIRLLCSGDVTITSSATAAISVDSLGSLGGQSGNNGYDVSFPVDGVAHKPNGVSAHGTAFGKTEQYMAYSADALYQFRSKAMQCGVGGAGADSQGGAYFNNTSSGGRGGGALLIECAGALNFTGTITAKGAAGQTGVPQAGGPGGGGTVVIIYNTLTANSGTITVTGGGTSSCTNPGGIGYGYCCGAGPGLGGVGTGTVGSRAGGGDCASAGGPGLSLVVQNKYF